MHSFIELCNTWEEFKWCSRPKLSGPSVIAEPFLCIIRCHQMTSGWADDRVRTIQSKVNHGQVCWLRHVDWPTPKTTSFAQCKDVVVCTMLPQIGDVIAKVFRCMTLHNILHSIMDWDTGKRRQNCMDAPGNAGRLATPTVICMTKSACKICKQHSCEVP